MSSQVVGIDIGSQRIRAVEVSGVGKARPVVLRHHEIALPDGAVKSGEVAEVNTVAAALKQLWQTAGFRSKKVVLGIGNPKVLVRDLTVPLLSPKEIRESLPTHVQDMLPVPVADALLDFYPITQGQSPTGDVVHGLLVAAVKESVLSNVKAVQRAGLEPVGVDLIPFALTRLHGSVEIPGNLAYVDVGARTTNVLVATDRVARFVRIIATGGHDVTRALSDQLEIDEEQAEALKFRLGLAASPESANAVPPQDVAAVQVIREVTSELLGSIRNTLNFFSNTRHNEPFTGIVLSGGGAKLLGFADALAEFTRIPVSVAEPFGHVELSRHVQKSDPETHGAMAVALGLALGSAA